MPEVSGTPGPAPRQWPIDGLLLSLCVIAFGPGMPAQLIRYDDSIYLFANTELLSRPGWAGFAMVWDGARAWRGDFVEFFPLRDSVYWLIYQRWELAGLPYHLVNLGFHVLASALLLRLGRALGLSPWAAAGAALLFAVHPIHIESVEWAAGLKDPMYSAALFGCLLAYLKYRERPRAGLYVLSLLLFIASLLVKSMALSAPLLLLAIERLIGTPAPWREIVRRLWGFGAIAALFLLQFILIGKANRVVIGPHGGSWPAHVVLTAWAQVKYLKQSLLPSTFRLIYCFEPPTSLLDARFFVALGLFVVLLVLLYRFRGLPLLVFGAVWYIACLLPVSNLVPFPAVMADRYLYAAVFGVCLVLATLLERLDERLRTFVLGAAVVALTLTCAARSTLWLDEENLWAEPDEDPECLTDRSQPASDAHLLRYRAAKDNQTKLAALERGLRTKGVKKSSHYCEALQSAATMRVRLGQADKGEAWALESVRVCPYDPASWSALTATMQHRNPVIALDAAEHLYRLLPSKPRLALVGLLRLQLGRDDGLPLVVEAARAEPKEVCTLVDSWAKDVPALNERLQEVLLLCASGRQP